MEPSSEKVLHDGLGSYQKPLIMWQPASPNMRSGRYFDWEAGVISYTSSQLRELTERQHAALVSLLGTLKVPYLDWTGDAPVQSVQELISLWRVPCPLLLIWDQFNTNDAFTLDGATSSAQNSNLISITFDGNKPGFGFSQDLIDLSGWDLKDHNAEILRSLASKINNKMDVYDIFVSYARVYASIADRICSELGKRHWNTWWDAALKPGDTFSEVIRKKLAAVKCVVVLWTKNSTRSAWVLDEATVGRDRGVLVPVRFGNVELPMGFGQVHTIGCPDDSETNIVDLCDKITAQILESTKKHPRPA